MSTFLVTYDLIAPTKDYSQLYKALKSYNNWAKITESCWCVISSNNSSQIRDFLQNYIDSNDKLFVCKLQGEAAWCNLSTDVSKWLQNNL